MSEQATIESILKNLRGYLELLQILAKITQSEFVSDFKNIESAKHLLQVAVQACLDIAQHIVATSGYRVPNNSYDTFVVLHEEGCFSDEFMPILRNMVGFRNRVVHLYWEVDDDELYEILQNNLGDFNQFAAHILTFVSIE